MYHQAVVDYNVASTSLFFRCVFSFRAQLTISVRAEQRRAHGGRYGRYWTDASPSMVGGLEGGDLDRISGSSGELVL